MFKNLPDDLREITSERLDQCTSEDYQILKESIIQTGLPLSFFHQILAVIKANADASQAHWGLVEKFLNQHTEHNTYAVGTSGHSVQWLKKLGENRRNTPKVSFLRDTMKIV